MPTPKNEGRKFEGDQMLFKVSDSYNNPMLQKMMDENGFYQGIPGYYERTEHFDFKAAATLPLPWADKDTSVAGAPVTDFVTDANGGQFNMALAADNEAEVLTLYFNDTLPITPDFKPAFACRFKINPDVTGATGEFRGGSLVIGLGSAQNDTPDSVARNAWIRIGPIGTGSGYLINQSVAVTGYPVGTTAVVVDTGSGTIVVGDVVKFANVTGYYVLTSALASNTFSFRAVESYRGTTGFPGLLTAVADNAAITVVGRGIYLEADDGTTDTDDRFSENIWANDTWITVAVDLTSLSDIKFYAKLSPTAGWVCLNRGAKIAAAALSGSTKNVQPYIQLQKAAAANNDHSLLIDKVWYCAKEA